MTGNVRTENGISLRGEYLVQDDRCVRSGAFKRTSYSVDGNHVQLHVRVGNYHEGNISLELPYFSIDNARVIYTKKV